ncbi:MAG: GNAT family N-acetyltransferase [Oligoflexales bacterium]
MKIKNLQDKQFPPNYHKLEALCLDWQFWPYTQILDCLSKPEYQLCVIEDYIDAPSKWPGALLSYHGPFSIDIVYLYINPKHRGRGLAASLLESLWATVSKEATMEALFLEVRKSNTSAIRAYDKFGMKQIGVRKSYYEDGEDALVFSREKNLES